MSVEVYRISPAMRDQEDERLSAALRDGRIKGYGITDHDDYIEVRIAYEGCRKV